VGGHLGQAFQAGQQVVVVGQQGGQFFLRLYLVVLTAFGQEGRCHREAGGCR